MNGTAAAPGTTGGSAEDGGTFTVDRAALRKRLTPLQYQVTQEKGTERYVLRVRVPSPAVQGIIK